VGFRQAFTRVILVAILCILFGAFFLLYDFLTADRPQLMEAEVVDQMLRRERKKRFINRGDR
jgi:hypothetical protein